ncbi:MAG TPA: class I SAM-dependent methyltransferase family protein [Methanosarcinaceae archaeon]|nr:class I SAM-dependent methyltransferase family protein [Methanosarcinaceae archaeon]
MNKTILIPVENAEITRSDLLRKNLLDGSRKIKLTWLKGKRFLEIPVKPDVEGYTVIEQDAPEYYGKWQSLKDRLEGIIPSAELEYVPSGWQLIGDVIIISISQEIDSRKTETAIAKSLLKMYPRCKSVIRDFGIRGQFREPNRKIIIGDKVETIHKEHKCLFRMDVTKIMYSKGNLPERKRMSKVGSGEIVVDMFAGIGYFSIPMGVHAKPEQVIAIELNPVSYGYLCENIKLNHVGNIVKPINGDCAEVTPQGVADRVIMGYVGVTHHYLKQGIRAIKKSGGVLHYHETTPESLLFNRPVSRIRDAARAAGRKVEIMECRRIKKYSPGVWHVVVDARIQ